MGILSESRSSEKVGRSAARRGDQLVLFREIVVLVERFIDLRQHIERGFVKSDRRVPALNVLLVREVKDLGRDRRLGAPAASQRRRAPTASRKYLMPAPCPPAPPPVRSPAEVRPPWCARLGEIGFSAALAIKRGASSFRSSLALAFFGAWGRAR